MQTLLKLRFIKALRLLKEIGWFYSILFLSFFLILLSLLYHSNYYLNTHPVSRLINTIILWTLLVSIHFKRADKIFLALKIKHYRRLFLIEYSIISLPVILWYLIMGWYHEIVLLACAVSIIPLLSEVFRFENNINNKTTFFLTKWLNPLNYVWLAGIRTYLFITGLFYISSLLFISNPFISIIFTFGITIFIMPSFYFTFEPLIFIECQNISSGTFLFRNVLKQFALYMLFLSPFLLIYLSLHIHHYLLVVGNIVIALFLLIWLNYFKYYVYNHIKITPMSYKYLSTIVVFLFPFAFPFLFIFMILKWKRFSINIDYYIHD